MTNEFKDNLKLIADRFKVCMIAATGFCIIFLLFFFTINQFANGSYFDVTVALIINMVGVSAVIAVWSVYLTK